MEFSKKKIIKLIDLCYYALQINPICFANDSMNSNFFAKRNGNKFILFPFVSVTKLFIRFSLIVALARVFEINEKYFEINEKYLLRNCFSDIIKKNLNVAFSRNFF